MGPRGDGRYVYIYSSGMDPCHIPRLKASVCCIDTRCTSGQEIRLLDSRYVFVVGREYLRLEQASRAMARVPRPLLALSTPRSTMYGVQDLMITGVIPSFCHGLHAPGSSPPTLRLPPPCIVLRWRALSTSAQRHASTVPPKQQIFCKKRHFTTARLGNYGGRDFEVGGARQRARELCTEPIQLRVTRRLKGEGHTGSPRPIKQGVHRASSVGEVWRFCRSDSPIALAVQFPSFFLIEGYIAPKGGLASQLPLFVCQSASKARC